jgi:hypothetical protein
MSATNAIMAAMIPAVLFRYTPDRKGERWVAHLGTFTSHLHAGLNELYGDRIARGRLHGAHQAQVLRHPCR